MFQEVRGAMRFAQHQETDFKSEPTCQPWQGGAAKAGCGHNSGNEEGQMPKQISPIESLIRSRLNELGLTEAEFLHRLGYRKMHTGRQHLKQLYLGDHTRRTLIQRLPEALELPPTLVRKALGGELAGFGRAMPKMLTSAQYHERRKSFFASLGPNPGTGMMGKWAWASVMEKKFHQTLQAENTWFESCVSDEYIALRDTPCVQSFLSGNPDFISLQAFNALVNEAVGQAFGEPTHIFELHPKSRDNFYARHRLTLGRILVQRDIVIHGKKYSLGF